MIDVSKFPKQYSVKHDVPARLAKLGFVAYVSDAKHPDGGPLSISWHLSDEDAQRTASILNAPEPAYALNMRLSKHIETRDALFDEMAAALKLLFETRAYLTMQQWADMRALLAKIGEK